MTRLKKPLEKCCNGCDKPPHPPSWVLCEDCFHKLDQNFHSIVKQVNEKESDESKWIVKEQIYEF